MVPSAIRGVNHLDIYPLIMENICQHNMGSGSRLGRPKEHQHCLYLQGGSKKQLQVELQGPYKFPEINGFHWVYFTVLIGASFHSTSNSILCPPCSDHWFFEPYKNRI